MSASQNSRSAQLLNLTRDERGVSTIETSIILSALLLMLFGTLQFGLALKARNEMNHALSEAIRLVHIDPATTSQDIIDYLENELSSYGTGDLDVSISQISGTSYMEIAVSYPFVINIPFAGASDITLTAASLAPMVSPTQ